jgi:bacillithiol biosynthesis cysteine-adding enzyme BshC
MDCRALPFSQLPHQPKIFLDYLSHFYKVKNFYGHELTAKSTRTAAQTLDFPKDRAAQVAEILRKQNAAFGSDSKTQSNLDRLANGAVAAVSGQQVGLFGGPSYSVYKALMAVQVADELTREGSDTVPVFWMATEDHDVDEIRHTTWFSDGRSTRFELPPAEAGEPVGRIKLGAAVSEIVREASDLLERQGSVLLAHVLRDSYAPEETYGSAFAKMFAKIFAGRGLILLDPLDPELHRLAVPIYQRAAAERDSLNEALLQRGKELEKAGYAAQVKVTSKSTLLFYVGQSASGSGGSAARQVVSATAANFQAGSKTWTRDEFVRLTHNEPENFSPNALLRPVLQDFLLPTVAYIGGSAEISYFAQSEVLYRALLGRMPVMLPRSGFTLVDVKAAKLLKQYHLKVEDVWQGSQEIRKRLERIAVPKALAAKFEREQKQISKSLAALGKQIEKLDRTLQGSVSTAQRKIAFQLDKLRRKVGRAQDKKNSLLSAHQQFLEEQLYPHHVLQSRELGFAPFLARWGPSALDELQKLSTLKKLGHHFILNWP